MKRVEFMLVLKLSQVSKCLFTLHLWGYPPATIHYICIINGSFPPKFRVLDRTLCGDVMTLPYATCLKAYTVKTDW